MTVYELIEFLKTQPQDAIVQVLCHDDSCRSYETQGGTCEVMDFTLEKDSNFNSCWDFTDFNGNKFVKADAPYYNKKYLLLGMQK